MKVKQSPADFRVEELTDRTPDPTGGFALYRLEKNGWTTPDAVGVVCKVWKRNRRQVSFGGLKDRHAVTTQFLTIDGGPPRNLEWERISLIYLGRATGPFTAADIRANRFTLTLRDLTREHVVRAAAAAAEVTSLGLPNYFDDQRFGSVGRDGEFVGRELVRGNFEAALKLALAAPYEHDRAAAKRAKATLRRHWGNWPACRAALPRGLAEYLPHNPTDFRGAISRLQPELQGMHLAAYQSDLWNRTLARWLKDSFPPESLGAIQTKRGDLPVPIRRHEDWNELVIPLPSARLKPGPDAVWRPALSAVLAEEGLTLDRLRVPGVRNPFFSKGERAALVRPESLSVEPGEDEMHPARRKLLLRFDLPRGSYATMVVKRLTATSRPPSS